MSWQRLPDKKFQAKVLETLVNIAQKESKETNAGKKAISAETPQQNAAPRPAARALPPPQAHASL